MKNLMLLCTFSLLLGCEVGKQHSSESVTQEMSNTSEINNPQEMAVMQWTQLEYLQHPCHGFCPVYQIVLQRDGNYVYNGERHTSQFGEIKSKLSNERTKAAFSAFEQLQRLGLPEVINRDNCALYATDHSIIEFKLRGDSKQWRFKHDLGCHAFTDRDRVLELTQIIQASLPIREHVNPAEK